MSYHGELLGHVQFACSSDLHTCVHIYACLSVCVVFMLKGWEVGMLVALGFFLRPQNNIPERKPKNINTLSCMCVCALLVILLHSLDDEVHLFISVCLYLCMYNFGPLYCKIIAVCNQHLLP